MGLRDLLRGDLQSEVIACQRELDRAMKLPEGDDQSEAIRKLFARVGGILPAGSERNYVAYVSRTPMIGAIRAALVSKAAIADVQTSGNYVVVASISAFIAVVAALAAWVPIVFGLR